MANGNYSRNERLGSYGRERGPGRFGEDFRNRGSASDWDRNGSQRDMRSDYDRSQRGYWDNDDYGEGAFGFVDEANRRHEVEDYYRDRDRRYSGAGRFDGRYEGERRGFVDRASDEVASWFGDEDAERRRQQDQHRGKGPKGYVRADSRIQDDVNDRLSDDAWLDASDIEVKVSSGEVTLTGQVATRADKRRAEDLAEMVSGVSNVQNNLRIRASAKDATVATAAKTTLNS